MVKANCPSCGGEIIFRSKTSVFAVCSYCRSNVVRHDVDLEAIGKQSELQEDMSPIQLGSRGKIHGKSFFVSGRIIAHWEDGRWNEWYVTFEDGSDGWIAEAQGDFSILSKPKKEEQIPPMSKIKVGNKIKIGRKKFEIVDIKEMTCIGSEGELPFRGIEGRTSVSVDLTHHDGSFASIEFNSEDGATLYVGEYASLKKMKMENLRLFNGWGRP